ncbi:MAG: ATP-binding cassette domain-containing protein [Candidatus Omnitrophica bacterium]|nr:ATP-binding cassette domain-containing protein [Candidatus Omnitrophota bacterium]
MSMENSELTVLEGVNWSISEADFWVVGGMPASGKSDLLATAAGLLRPQRGALHLFGRDTASFHGDELARERLRVGLVFGDGGRPFRYLTVAENLAMPMCYHQDCAPAQVESTVNAMLEYTGLDFLAHQPASRLNRSWRQRVGLARALILHPEVLLLDNPLAGMDPRQASWWMGFLGKLSAGHELYHGRPLTLAVATDDFRPWLAQGRQFALLKQNHWLPLGGPADLDRCAEPLVQELLASPVR